MMSAEEDDPVVKEIDVFITHELAHHLVLVQYPLRPSWRPLHAPDISEVRIKPLKHASAPKVEIDVTLPVNPDHYDTSSEWKLTKETLKSHHVPLQTNYAVGILKEVDVTDPGYRIGGSRDQLHLTPVQSALQMRPGFGHVDAESEQRRKEEAALKREEDGEDDEAAAAAAQLKQQQTELEFTFQKGGKPKSLAAKRFSAAAAQAREEQETPWVPLQLFDSSTDEHARVFEKLLSTQPDHSIQWDVSREGYLDLLAPVPPQEPYVVRLKHIALEGTLSLVDLRNMTDLGQQVHAIMTAGQVLHFKQVFQLASLCNGNRTMLLAALSQMATLVANRWVVRSELVCGGGMVHVRDLVLLRFQEGGVVKRGEISELSGCPVDRLVSHILSKIGTTKSKEGWSLKLPVDEEFVSTNPEAVARAERYWQEKKSSILTSVRQVKLKIIPLDAPAQQGPKMTALPASALRTLNVPTASSGIQTAMSPQTAQQTVPQQATTTTTAAQMPPPPPPPAPGAQYDIADEAVVEVLMEEWKAEYGKYIEPLAEVYSSLLKEFGCCTFVFLQDKLRKQTESTTSALAGVKLPEKFCLVVLQSVARTMHSTWYLRKAINQRITQHRNVVLKMFQSSISNRKKDIKEAIIKELGPEQFDLQMFKVCLDELTTPKGTNQIWKSVDGSQK